MRFENKVILITGAARGIGLSAAELFAKERGMVVLTDTDSEKLSDSVNKLRSQDLKVEGVSLNVTNRREWESVVTGVVEKHGRLDVLINNAGLNEVATVEDTTIEQWQKMMSVNRDGVFHGIQFGVAAMKETGGVIINVASITADVAAPELVAYGTSKAAVSQLSKTATVDRARKGYNIRINSIHPGFTDTRMVDKMLDSLGNGASTFAKSIIKGIPMKRLARPCEIAKPILFLASDGGYTAA